MTAWELVSMCCLTRQDLLPLWQERQGPLHLYTDCLADFCPLSKTQMTATCSIPVQDTATHWFVALARVVCLTNTWWKVPVWHLLPKNGLFRRLLPFGACIVIPGSLLPVQEGGKLPAIAARHKAVHRGVWLSQHLVICHLPLWGGLFHCSRCWEVVVFSVEFCISQVVCNLPALQGEVNVVAKAPSGWIIFHQGPRLWLVLVPSEVRECPLWDAVSLHSCYRVFVEIRRTGKPICFSQYQCT